MGSGVTPASFSMPDSQTSLVGDAGQLIRLWDLQGSPMKEEFNVKDFNDFMGYLTLPRTTTGDPEDRSPFIGIRVCY
jgi:hypothetical protein